MYFPVMPLGYEVSVMLLVNGVIRLYAIGMPLMYLDESVLAWRELP
jgi:predicted membrane-bound mannosyltransferase